MTMKKILILILLVLCASVVYSADYDQTGVGQFLDSGSSTLLSVEYDTSFITDTASGSRTAQHPIVVDLDNNIQFKEVVTYNGKALQVYRIDNEGLSLITSTLLNRTIKAVVVVTDPYAVNPVPSDKLILVFTDQYVKEYKFNQNNLAGLDTIISYSTISTISDPDCDNNPLVDNAYTCVFSSGNDIYYLDPLVDGNFVYDYNSPTNYNVFLVKSFGKFYFVNETASNVLSLKAVDITDPNTPVTTVLKSRPATTSPYADIIADDENVCFNYNNLNTNFFSHLSCFRDTTEVVVQTSPSLGNLDGDILRGMVFYNINDDASEDICLKYHRPSFGDVYLKCYSLDTNTESYSNGASMGTAETTAQLIGAGNLKQIDTPYFILLESNILTFRQAYLYTNEYNISTLGTGKYIFIDANNNNQQEIIGTRSTGIVAVFKNPQLIDSIYLKAGAVNGGLFGFFNPTCNNSLSNTFTARECLGSDFTHCTYFSSNINAVRERLCTTCAGTIAYTCGNYSMTEPVSPNCLFPVIGNKNITVNFETETSLNTTVKSVNFILGVTATGCLDVDNFVYPQNYTPPVVTVECNDGLDNDNDGQIDFPNDTNCTTPFILSEGVDQEPTTPPEETRTTWEIIRDNIFTIITVIIIIITVAGFAYTGLTHPFVLTTVVLCELMVATIINWFPLGYMIVLVVCLVAIAVIMALMNRSGGN